MIVDKVQEIISFEQSKWLEKYIGYNTHERKKAFEQEFSKLPNYDFMESFS